ncbi:MAG: hypothetical protein V8T24_09905 [Roseburia hominis]
MGSEEKARETIRLMKEAGYDGIELNGFMIKKMPPIVRVLTTLAGMPIGKTAKLDWKKLIADTGLKVVSIHEDLGRLEEIRRKLWKKQKHFPQSILSLRECIGLIIPIWQRYWNWHRS